MSLYGNVKKIGSASFQFDRKYPNRAEMDSKAQSDGVYAGRYVLVEYGYRFGISDEDLVTISSGTAVSQNPKAEYAYQALTINDVYNSSNTYYTLDENDHYIEYSYNETSWNNLISQGLIFKKVPKINYQLINTENGMRVEGVEENPTFKANAAIDLTKYGAVYDSTVWQKIYVDGKDKYIMVAELNAMAPKLDITQDKPLTYKALSSNVDHFITEGIVSGKLNENNELIETVRLTNAEEKYNKPYFDTAIDTELTYLMHLPTTLNLEVDNSTIDFHKEGFNMAYSYPDSEGVSTIAWIPKELDQYEYVYEEGFENDPDHIKYDLGNNKLAKLIQGADVDTKMLFMSFPALGNAMNALYNLLYGKPDPEDDITQGALRPYFKRFLDNITMKNPVVVYEDNSNPNLPAIPHYITFTNGDKTEYIYVEGKIGETATPEFNEYDALRLVNLQPSQLVEVRFRDDTIDHSEEPPYTSATAPYTNGYYNLNSSWYTEAKAAGHQGKYVLWDKAHSCPISMEIHIPTGNEDPDLEWLKDIPALSDILANNTAGLATVLSSLFGDVDPLTGTTRYYLYNDWRTKVEEGSSTPAIANKPKVVGGYEQTFISVQAEESNIDQAGRKFAETPGYFYNIGTGEEAGSIILYPHTEITTSNFYSGGDYVVNYDTWQLVNYKDPVFTLMFNKISTDISSNVIFNQDAITVNKSENGALITSTVALSSFSNSNLGEGEHQWIGIDIDTGFSSIQGIYLNEVELTDADEIIADSYDLPKGHIAYWMKADEGEAVLTFAAKGFKSTTITLTYQKVNG